MRRPFIVSVWLAYLAWGIAYSLMAPMWDGFDEPFHLAYIEFVAAHGRPPGFNEPSLPAHYLTINRELPSMVGYGAPSFVEWAAMGEDERLLHRRAASAWKPAGADGIASYAGENYERQQGPLFYFLAAPVSLLFRDVSLPLLVVIMRIFCVLLSSAVIPIGALLIARSVTASAVYVGLPILALMPNTVSYVFRISNEALVWPLLALAALLLVGIVESPSRNRLAGLGIVLVLGIFTKLTLVPLIPIAFLALLLVRRDLRRKKLLGPALLALVAVPSVALSVLMWWNWSASGSITGLVEAVGSKGAEPGEYLRALFAPRVLEVIPPLMRNHLWAGGWGFVQPAKLMYEIAFIAIGSLGVFLILRIARRGSVCVSPARRLVLPVSIAIIFALAMLWHIASFTVAAQQDARFAGIGAEGWYFDAIRPVQAVIYSWLWCAASVISYRLVVVHLLILTLWNIALTFGLMASRWAGGELRGLRDLVIAAPLAISPWVVLALAVLFVASVLSAAVAARDLSTEG